MTKQTQNTQVFLKKYDAMKAQMQSWQSTWKELSKFIAPTRGFFDGDQPNSGKKIDHRTLIDSDPMLAVEVLSAGMMSGLTNPSRSWFELTLSDPQVLKQNGVRNWLYEVRRRMEDVFGRSNVYNALHSFYQEIAVFGTAAFLLEEDEERVLSCRSFTAGEYVLGLNEQGKIDSFGREFFMTVEQMIQSFGKENLPFSVRRNAPANQEQWVKVIHVI